MSDKILTVIVPSYNMEKYLPTCLGSLVVAPELMEKLEVLVVNDGSKDRTSEIAHEFEAKYPRTFKVIDKANGHYGSCVNAGLAVACGTYVKILDADDSFDTAAFTDYMSFLVNTVESEWLGKPDMIWNDFVWEDEKGVGFKTMRRNLPPRQLFDIEDAAVDLDCLYMHQIAYKTENLRAIGYHQDEGICYTDNEWCHLPIFMVKMVTYCNVPLYRYLYGREGQSVDAKVIQKNLWMMMKVAIRMSSDAMNSLTCSLKVRQYLQAFAITCIGNVYNHAIFDIHTHEIDDRLFEFDAELRQVAPDLYEAVGRRLRINFLDFRYVETWRRKRNSRTLLLFACRMYRRMRMWVSNARRS